MAAALILGQILRNCWSSKVESSHEIYHPVFEFSDSLCEKSIVVSVLFEIFKGKLSNAE
jgi:hypothetical protein